MMRILHLVRVLLRAFLFSIVCFSSLSLAADSGHPSKNQELILLNWSEYLDPELLEKFEQQYGVRVREVYFESDDLRDDMLLDTNGEGFDIVLVSGVSLDVYLQQDWLEPLDVGRIPNLKLINPRLQTAFPGTEMFAVPYAWGTLGIVYRKDLIDGGITNWMELFRPDEKLQHKIAMMRSSRDLMGMALKALGYSANSTVSEEIRAAEKLLLEQKPYVYTYTYVSVDEDSALIKGDVVASMMYSGDALSVKDHFDKIEYVLPAEGGNIWIDYWTVLKSSKQKELAWQFLNFMNEPENAAQASQYIFYASPNTAAEKLLPREFLEDPFIYPDERALEKSEFYKALPPRVEKKRNQSYTKIID
jgi:spermidine/putrescine transport system substrate-binding protein